jgi:Dolichyl-phosphate-mannose-protein mannosyltransferase
MDKVIKDIWKNHKIFLIILFVGVLLRFFFIYFQGLSNDELSAWYRTRYSLGEEFWRLGVSEGDMHPAFYQILLWFWVRIFGDSEFSLRATAILFFILNLSLIYRIACQFFSKYTGLIISAFYASLGFLIVHTTTARPYNSGVFFLLLTFYFLLLLREKKQSFGAKNTLVLSFAFFGAMTSHYFAFLSVGILSVIGLLSVEKNDRKFLLISGGSALLLFVLLHFSITREQLSQGGLGWLDAPSFWWFFEFSKLTFQNSSFMLFVGIGLIYFVKNGATRPSPSQGISLVVMISIGLVAYLVSIIYTPILRELVFQFILPFAFFGIVGPVFLEKKDGVGSKIRQFMPFIIVTIFSIHSITFYKLFQPVHYGVFRELAENQKRLEARWGKSSFTYAQNTNNFDYLNYYLQDSTATENITDWVSPEAVYELNERIRSSKTPYFLYNWSNNHHDPMFLECIRRAFPRLESKQEYFNSASYCYSRKLMDQSFSTRLLMEIDEGAYVDSGQVYFGGNEIKVRDLRRLMSNDQYMILECEGSVQNANQFYLVAQAVDSLNQPLMKGKNALFYSAYNQQKLNPKVGMKEMFAAFTLPKELKDSDIIKFYCWNPEKGIILFNNFKLYALE